MFRTSLTGSLVAASLAASALAFMPAASAAPTYLDKSSPSTVGNIPTNARVVMSENGSGLAVWLREINGKKAVQASSFTNGAWSTPATVSSQNAEVAYPDAAINDQGVAVAAWQQKDENDQYHVRVNRLVSGGFTSSEQISTGTYSATGPMDTAVDGSGRFWAAYQVTDNGPINQIRVVADGGKGPAQLQWWNLGDTSSFAPDLAVNAKGEALLAYYNAGEGSSTIDVRRLAAGSTDWLPTKSVGTTGQYKIEAETSIGDDGTATVGYVREDLDGDYRASVARVKVDGAITGQTYVSPAGVTTDHISLGQNDVGAAVLAWNQANTEVGYRTRAFDTAGWAAPSAINAALTGTTYPKVAISDTGAYVIGWTNNGDLHSAYRGTPSVLPFVTYKSSAIEFGLNDTSAGIDNQGNAFVGGVYALPNPTQGALHVKFVDAGGPTSTLANLPANSLGKKLSLTWSAKDRLSAVTAYDVLVTTTLYNSTTGSQTSLKTGSPSTATDVTLAPGRTYCFRVRARDAYANYGGFTAPKCTTTPLDDRAGVISKGFKRKTAATSYLGTYSKATKKGAVMSFQHVKANRIAILVSKVKNGGKIKVTYAGKKVGTYSLKGSGHQKIVAAKAFGAPKSGTLVIKVISKSGKVVRIDGLVVAK